jgi:hypothetical protein
LNGEIKRRTEAVGIFPNEAANTRLVGAILLEQNDERAVQSTGYITLESMVPAIIRRAARSGRLIHPTLPRIAVLTNRQIHHGMGHDAQGNRPGRRAYRRYGRGSQGVEASASSSFFPTSTQRSAGVLLLCEALRPEIRTSRT